MPRLFQSPQPSKEKGFGPFSCTTQPGTPPFTQMRRPAGGSHTYNQIGRRPSVRNPCLPLAETRGFTCGEKPVFLLTELKEKPRPPLGHRERGRGGVTTSGVHRRRPSGATENLARCQCILGVTFSPCVNVRLERDAVLESRFAPVMSLAPLLGIYSGGLRKLRGLI